MISKLMYDYIEEYILNHISPEPSHLQNVYRNTYLHHLYPRMCSGHLQGRLLKMLTQMIRPRYILEIGTFTGYSALCFAEGMPQDAQLHTIEIDDEAEDELLETFGNSPWKEHIHLHIGDALDIIPALDCTWDLVFIDGNKRNYTDYYELVLPKVREGGYIIADNTLWSGKITDVNAHDAQTKQILLFNDHVVQDPRVEKVILPIRDGMTIIRKNGAN